jgi:hypothetical protein
MISNKLIASIPDGLHVTGGDIASSANKGEILHEIFLSKIMLDAKGGISLT